MTMFQFTLPRGERLRFDFLLGIAVKFQFTLPRGERLYVGELRTLLGCFNSRSREGSDI